MDICFYFLATINNAAINIYAQVFLWTHILISLGYIFRCTFAWSYSDSMFNLWGNCQTIFYKGCTILNSHQQCMKVSINLHLHQCLLFSVILIIAILVGMKWYLIVCVFFQGLNLWPLQCWILTTHHQGSHLIVVLIHIFLLDSDVEHLVIFFLTIAYVLGEMSIQILCPF